jgi:hypothetical protein
MESRPDEDEMNQLDIQRRVNLNVNRPCPKLASVVFASRATQPPAEI